MYYKELYKANSFMWMDLWEKEKLNNTELYLSLVESNKEIIKQDAVIQHAELINSHLTETNESLTKDLIKETKRKKKWRKASVFGIPVAFAGGVIATIIVVK